MFPLCRSCAENRQQEICHHNDEERTLRGSFVTIELYKALELGYKIVKFHEVWHYSSVEVFVSSTRTVVDCFRDILISFSS